jgi:hypothetical protein
MVVPVIAFQWRSYLNNQSCHFKLNSMEIDFLDLDVDVLNRLYKAKEKELEAAILKGTSWDEVSIKRKALTELSSALHTKLERQGIHSPKFPARPGAEI